MSKSVDAIIDGIIRRESSAYTNDPSDRGGPTKFGITLATLRRIRGATVTASDVAALTEAEAREIYEVEYISAPRFDLVLTESETIGIEVIDTGVNCGQEVAATMLQVALNALNNRGTAYPDIVEDGRVGPATAGALRAYLAWRGQVGERVLLEGLNHLQGARYIKLSRDREVNEKFVYGWLKERASTRVVL